MKAFGDQAVTFSFPEFPQQEMAELTSLTLFKHSFSSVPISLLCDVYLLNSNVNNALHTEVTQQIFAD